MTISEVTAPDQYKLAITEIIEEAPDVKTFRVSPVNGEPEGYRAGQFLVLAFDTIAGEERRSYSFSSSPVLDEPMAFSVKRIPNGLFSRWLIDKAVPGDILTCTGVAGLFTLPASLAGTDCIVLFAAGIGITPLFSILKTVLYTESTRIVLVYSNRAKGHVVFLNELQVLEKQFPGRLTIEWLFSDHKKLLQSRLTRAYLTGFLKKLQSDCALSSCQFYMCGPTDYMWLVNLLLEENGVLPEQVHREIFVNQRPPIPQTPPDTSGHTATIIMDTETFLLPVTYPDTILSAAKKAGIRLPYSCEAGRCSGCIARCTSGTVWMAYNEVLTEKDIAKGMVLTCVGYPVDGDITITYSVMPGLTNENTIP